MNKLFSPILLFIAIIFACGMVLAAPSGANFTHIKTEQAAADGAAGRDAVAGNVTELSVTGYSTTSSWQGYYGNVSGTIQLADGSDNVMYNWSSANPGGEIYAANHSSILWTNVQCFNYTATGNLTADDSALRGSTSLNGLNLSTLESVYGIISDDADGIDETFNLIGAATHDAFYSNSLQFTEGECRSTRVYSNVGSGEGNKFEEVLLYDPDNQAVVFASILDSDILGFDNRTHDFEMMVPEDGHSGNTATTRYYFYVELDA
jgi:hypothetical protein